MEMRATFHLKFHMHYFKATLFQYGENQKVLMGLMMLFKKKKEREIKNTKKQKDVARYIKSHFSFTNRKDAFQLFLLYCLLTGKRKAGSQVSHWPQVKASSE